jgi:hypothetical protein
MAPRSPAPPPWAKLSSSVADVNEAMQRATKKKMNNVGLKSFILDCFG